MNRQEISELADYLESRLREIGESEIADPQHYTIEDEETGEQRLVEPRKRVVLMLEALERAAALLDRQTLDVARERLEQNVEGMEDVDILLRRVDGPDRERAPFRFDQLETNGDMRSEFQVLRAHILEDFEE